MSPVWEERDEAISPVVGVMLMLSITLIVAALVSAFAGGVISVPSKTPQATIQATYSQTNGMKIQHMGGDPIAVGSIIIYVRPTSSFNDTVTKYVWHIDKSYILVDGTTSWNSSPAFIAGDTVRIDDLKHVQTRSEGITENEAGSDLDFLTAAPGKSFVIEFYDGGGKMIAQSAVVITP